MKNLFHRKHDTQPKPSRSNNEAYKFWLPHPEVSRATVSRPSAWIPTSGQSSARRGAETQTHRSSVPQVDASAPTTSSTYKYATAHVPPNAGFYYPSNPAQAVQPLPPLYSHPLPVPPPLNSFDRPDSRTGYVAYPYQTPQYPQTFPPAPASSQPNASQRREDKIKLADGDPGSVPPPRPSYSKKQSDKEDGRRAQREPSSSSLREHIREDVEVKKPKHKTREPSETRKRRDSRVGEPAKHKSDRTEARRDGKLRRLGDLRVEEEDSSDSSIQRPSSSAAHRPRRLADVKAPLMQESKPFSRTGIPVQPTTASSSSGKQTPPITRMPVYLPANQTRPQRRDDRQLGLSESDTDHGTLNRGRNVSRDTALPAAKYSSQSAAVPRAPADKKVKESRGLWPFSRSKSSQKLPQTAPVAAPNISRAMKARADSTPSRFPQVPVPGGPTAPSEYRRHASDNTNSSHPGRAVQADGGAAPQESRPAVPDFQPSSSRTMAFVTQPSRSTSVPPNFTTQALNTTATPADSYPQTAVSIATLSGQVSGPTPGASWTQRPEIPLRRDARDMPTLPPIYSQAAVSSSSVPDRSTTPKVSQLVAGFEARVSDTTTYVPQQTKPPPTSVKRDVPTKPTKPMPPRMHVPPQQNSQLSGDTLASVQSSAPVNPYTVTSQPPPSLRTLSDGHIRPAAEVSNVQARTAKQPDVLRTQYRDLLSDKPSASRDDEKTKPAEANKSHSIPTSDPAGLYFTSRPQDWSSYAQPPIQVYTAAASSMAPPKSTKTEKPVEHLPPNPTALSSSRRPVQSESADRPSRVSGSKIAEESRDGRTSRSKKDLVAVMKTPSKDSSRHTSSPSPVFLATNSTNAAHANDRPQMQSASRSQIYPEVMGKQPTGVPSTSVLAGDRTSHKDYRTSSANTGRVHPNEPSITPSNIASTPFSGHSERSRYASAHSLLSNPSLPPPPNVQPVRPPSRAANVPAVVETSSGSLGQSSSRPSTSNSYPHTVPRVPSEDSILKTPSSLAQSVLPPLQPSVSRTSIPTSVSSETRKKGILGMFRSKEQSDVPPDAQRDRAQPFSSESVHRSDRSRRFKQQPPPPITIPNPAVPISERKSPNSRVFTPFRYLSTKRKRRVSTASMDAVNGTAPNTVMGSPTASMQSSQMPAQSPPQRDPMLAAQDWRNQDETQIRTHGKTRRLRPGVVFDVAEDPGEESRPRPMRSSRKTQAQSDPPTTDSSDG